MNERQSYGFARTVELTLVGSVGSRLCSTRAVMETPTSAGSSTPAADTAWCCVCGTGREENVSRAEGGCE